jgi:hypothetical protein
MKISVRFLKILSPMNGTSVEEHCLMYADEINVTSFNKTIKLCEFKTKDNVRLGCDDIPHTSGFSTRYK